MGDSPVFAPPGWPAFKMMFLLHLWMLWVPSACPFLWPCDTASPVPCPGKREWSPGEVLGLGKRESLGDVGTLMRYPRDPCALCAWHQHWHPRAASLSDQSQRPPPHWHLCGDFLDWNKGLWTVKVSKGSRHFHEGKKITFSSTKQKVWTRLAPQFASDVPGAAQSAVGAT